MSKKKQSPAKTIFILGQPFRVPELIRLALIFLLFAGVAIATIGYLLYSNVTRYDDSLILTKEEVEIQKEWKEATENTENFLDYYLRTTAFDQVNSLRLSGTYTTSNTEFDLQLLAKQPHFYKQVLEKGGYKLEIAFDGKDIWQKQNRDVVDESNKDLLALNKILAIMECSIPSIAWRYEKLIVQEGDGAWRSFEAIPDFIHQGESYSVLINREQFEYPLKHFLEPKTCRELFRQLEVPNDSGETRLLEVRFVYEDIEYSEADLESKPYLYYLPSGLSVHMDDTEVASAKFSKPLVNRGLLDYLFERPN